MMIAEPLVVDASVTPASLPEQMSGAPTPPDPQWRGVRLHGPHSQALSREGQVEGCHRLVLQWEGQAEIQWRPDQELEVLHAVRKVGQLSIFPAGVPLWMTTGGVGKVVEVELEPAFFRAESHGLAAAGPLELVTAMNVEDELLSALVRALKREVEAGVPGGRTYGEALGASMAAHLALHYSRPAESGRGSGQGLTAYQLKIVNDYIEAHFTRPISLASLAATVRLSTFHFARLFKQSTGLAPHQHILRRRVEEARRLLASSGTPILEIARRVGFADQSHLALHFRRLFGMTPRAFRHSLTPNARGTGPAPLVQGRPSAASRAPSPVLREAA